LLRASWRSPQRLRAVLRLHEMRIYLGLLLGWLLLGLWLLSPIALAFKLSGLAALPLILLLAISWRKRSLERGLYALVAWHCNSAGLLRGLLKRRQAARQPIACQRIQPAPGMAPEAQTPINPYPSAHVRSTP
jgi:hypothetical protein